MKLLSFLGTRHYEEITYYLADGREYQTPLFAEALTAWFSPEEVLVFLTEEAAKHSNWADLKESLSIRSRVTPVDIPSGRTEEELWEIFTKLTAIMREGDEILFDITHAFRSLPILVLLAAAYLRVAKSVKLKAILYGAYEARDDRGRAPVFDLTPFLGMLDWTVATARFIDTGDAGELANLLKEAHRLPWKERMPTTLKDNMPHYLRKLGGTLMSISRALLLVRPHEVAQHANMLVQSLREAAPEVGRWAQPFEVLLKRVGETYSGFTTDDLAMQLELIRWYVELERITQAIILAREWVITWGCNALGLDRMHKREEVESALNEAAAEKSKRTVNKRMLERSGIPLERFEALPSWNEVVGIWGRIRDLRNDVAHCGMRASPRSSDAIVKGMKQVLEKLQKLPLGDAA